MIEEIRKFVEQAKTVPWADLDLTEFIANGPGWVIALLEYVEKQDAEIERLKTDCARISAEFGLPSGMVPVDGWVAAQVELWRKTDECNARLKDQLSNPGTTHFDGCWRNGPRHWMCAVNKLDAIEVKP